MKFAVPIAGALSVFQLLISAWSLVADWAGQAAKSTRAVSDNYLLVSQFEELAKRPPDRIIADFDTLMKEYRRQESIDAQAGIAEKEKRRGYRYALLQYGLKCKACGKIPAEMKSTKCGSCGQI